MSTVNSVKSSRYVKENETSNLLKTHSFDDVVVDRYTVKTALHKYSQVSKYVIYFVTRAMSTNYVESEARAMSLALIEGIAEIKRP